MKVFILYTTHYLSNFSRILVRRETSDKISHMNSTIVLYCNGIAKISVRGDIQQKCIYQRLSTMFEKFMKNLHKNLKLSPKFLKIKFNRIFLKI